MNLVEDIIAAHDPHGRRMRFERIEADIVTGGSLFPLKGLATDITTRRMSVWLHEPRASVAPFGAPDQRSAFSTDRVAVEKLDGQTMIESTTPSTLFVGHGLNTAGGPLHRAYFNGYALWTYLNTPFLLGMPGVEVVQMPDRHEDDKIWHVLRAWFPGRMTSHSAHQEFYFGPDLRLRRHDSIAFQERDHVFEALTYLRAKAPLVTPDAHASSQLQATEDGFYRAVIHAPDGTRGRSRSELVRRPPPLRPSLQPFGSSTLRTSPWPTALENRR